jgi:hypothetical protein
VTPGSVFTAPTSRERRRASRRWSSIIRSTASRPSTPPTRGPSTCRFAGVASLMIAKLHKIAERKDVVERRQDKDGLDVLRLLRFAGTDHLARTLTKNVP